KAGIKMLLDQNKMEYKTTTDLYSLNDTIQYSEQQNINNHPLLTNLSINAQLNKEKYYFNNALKFAYSKETNSSLLLNNEIDMKQRLKNQVHSFSNNLE